MSPNKEFHIRLRCYVSGLTMKPLFRRKNHLAGTPGEKFIEDWEYWVTIESDGTNPFLQLPKGSGWCMLFVRLKDNDVIISPTENESRFSTSVMAPGSRVDAIVLTEKCQAVPGVSLVQRVTNSSGQSSWAGETILPYASA